MINLNRDNPELADAITFQVFGQVYVNGESTNLRFGEGNTKNANRTYHRIFKLQGEKIKLDGKDHTIQTGNRIQFRYNINFTDPAGGGQILNSAIACIL